MDGLEAELESESASLNALGGVETLMREMKEVEVPDGVSH